jgi:hypothetical protein
MDGIKSSQALRQGRKGYINSTNVAKSTDIIQMIACVEKKRGVCAHGVKNSHEENYRVRQGLTRHWVMTIGYRH